MIGGRPPAPFFLLWAVLSGSACAPAWKATPHDRFFQATPAPRLHPKPAARSASTWWNSVVHAGLRPLGETISPGHWVERLIGGREALDVNALGQVVDSPWYENRITRGDMDRRRAARGPNRLDGPAPGTLLVLGGKVEGATPGLLVRDEAGSEFLVKFDPPAFPEMASGAEIISTKILFAAGYNVPENYVVRFELDRLVLAPGATTRGEYGAVVPLDAAGLAAIIAHVNPYPDGQIRALFSRLIPGEGVGHFDYRGARPDDPNDRLPHELRRSLRGLKVFQSWLNNTDVSAENTYDSFIARAEGSGETSGSLVHYLLDFGGALGAAGVKPKHLSLGFEHLVDWPAFGAAVFSLGLQYPAWLAVRRSPYRAVGIFESDVFAPERWRPEVPNPAFDAATPLDEYWAASVLARFTPDLLAAIVATAEYSEPGAPEWVLRVLSERQFRWMAHAFRRVLPLDLPSVEGSRLELLDLEVATGLETDLESLRYRWVTRWNRRAAPDPPLDAGEGPEPLAELSATFDRARSMLGFQADPFVTVRWVRLRPDGSEGPELEVHLRVLPKASAIVVGLDRRVQ